MASGKKSGAILWTSIAAAAAGVVAVAVVMKLKSRSITDGNVEHRLRDVQDVLTDCYKKISEIEHHLPELIASDVNKGVSRFNTHTQLKYDTGG